MSKQPLLIMLLAFCFGIFSQDYFKFDFWIILSFLLFSGLAIGFSWFKIELALRLKNYFLGIFFLSLGLFFHHENSEIPDLVDFNNPKQDIVFQLKKKLNNNEKNRRYEIEILKVESLKKNDFSPFLSIVNIPKDRPLLDFEHFYNAEVYINPVKKTAQDFQFDYQKYLSRQQIYFQTYIKGGVLSLAKSDISFSDKIKQKRLSVLANINQSSLQARNKEFLKGIILADRTEMDDTMVNDFGRSGLMHFLAISGSHMAIIFWLILLILKPVFSVKLKNVPIIIALVLIWMFAVFIDYGSSVVRSCIMITVYYTMVMLQRKPDLLHSMAVSAFIILLIDTQQLYDVGFQLSYLAVFGIYWLNPILLDKFRIPKYKIETFFYSIITISLSAQLATLPLVLYYFHQFSALSIIANLVVLPFSEVIIILSILMVILYSFKINIGYLDFVYDQLISWLMQLIHFFASRSELYSRNVGFGLIEVLICFLGFYFLRDLIKSWSFRSVVRFASVVLLFCGSRMAINFYSVQKNEVISVENFKDNMLIIKEKSVAVFAISDSTKIINLEKSVINPYLTSRRISSYKIVVVPDDANAIIYNKKKYGFRNK